MSNLLKSKFLLGVMTLAIMLAGVVAVNANTAAAADCSTGTATLRVGSRGQAVVCLQATLDSGIKADGVFGPLTKARVVAWQKTMNLVADGVFGPKSRTALGGVSVTVSSGCPAGALYNPATGVPCSSTTPVVTASGPVSAMLASDNPASGYIINNQATADLAHFAFSGAGTVSSVTLHRTGISNQNTLTNVYLYDGATRLTDGFSFNNVGDLVMNNLGIMISGSKVISVKADVSSTAANDSSTLGVNLTSFTAMGNAATSSNLMGNIMYVGTGSPAGVVLNSANQTVTGSRTVNAGTSSYTVWSNPIQVNTRAVWLKGANFRMTGSAPADALQNIKLFVDGIDSGSVANMGSITGSNYAMFNFTNPISLSTGSHTIDVRADVVKGASYTVTVSLQQVADLVLYDGQVGVNVAVTKDGTAAYTASSSGTITINPGSASVTVDPAFQIMTNVTGGATNVPIARFKVHGYGEDVKVSSLDVLPVLTGCTPSCSGLNNVTVFFNGSQVGSSFNWTSAFHQFTLGSQMIIPAGTDSYIEVRADLQTSGSVNYTAGTVSATLNLGAGNGQGQTSHTSVNFPSGDVVGTSLTIQTGTLSVSKSSYANTTSNPNTTNVKIGEFVLQNQSTSESVRVTTLAVNLFNDAGTALSASTNPLLTNFSNLRTSETSGAGAQPIQPAATNTFSVDFTIAPNATKTIAVYADTGAQVSSYTVKTTLTVTSIGASSNVSVSQNGNGTAVTGQTITLIAATVAAPTLVSSFSTSSQFVPALGGATNATVAEFNVKASNGAATISEAKFVVRGTATISALNTVSSVSIGAVSAPVILTATNTTTSATNISSSATTFDVAAATGITAGTVLTIGSEQMLVTSDASGTTVDAVTRGYNGTTAVAHDGSSTPVAVTVSNGVAYLTGLNLSVPNGGSGLNVDAMVTYSPVGTGGITSGLVSNISLSYLKYSAGGSTRTRCVASCDDTSAEVAAPTMMMVGSVPALSVATTSNASLTNNSETHLMDVTITPNAKGSVQLNTVVFTVVGSASSGTITLASPRLADSNGTTITAFACTPTPGPTSIATAADFTCTASGGYPLSAAKTFALYGTPAFSAFGAANTSSITTKLKQDAGATFSWTDIAGGVATGGTAQTGNNATYLYAYPTGTWSTHN